MLFNSIKICLCWCTRIHMAKKFKLTAIMRLFMITGLICFLPSIISGEYYSLRVSKETEGRSSQLKQPQNKQKPVYRSFKAKLGRYAPDWKGIAVINGTFQEISLSDYRGKYLIFLFYPLDFTFVCPTEIRGFNDRIEDFRKINTEVIAVSVDSQFAHLAWINTPQSNGGLGNVSIPLLSDLSHKIAKSYGVYSPEVSHAYRGLFIIDPKGIVRHVTLNDVPVGRNVDETLRLVQAYQHTDTHGEVCPAGWKPGEKTIVIPPCNNSSKPKDEKDTEPKSEKTIKQKNTSPIRDIALHGLLVRMRESSERFLPVSWSAKNVMSSRKSKVLHDHQWENTHQRNSLL